jgi:Arc/MetJ-type ribon-helix-helix transcriptional regulator
MKKKQYYSMSKISVKLDEDAVKKIDSLVKKGAFDDRRDAVSFAVRRHLLRDESSLLHRWLNRR